MNRFTFVPLALVSLSLGTVPGCFSEPGSDSPDGSSSGGASSSSSGLAGSSGSSDSSSGEGQTSGAGTTAFGTGSTGSTGSTGALGSSSGDTGAGDSSSTGSGPLSLCPAWFDEFDGGVFPAWEFVWDESIEQTDGQTIITLTAEPGDQYPRRVLPWAALGVPGDDTVRFVVTPATLPVVMGTQLNAVFEGPPGNDVTLSLNNTGLLEFRLTSRFDGSETVWAEETAVFPPGASISFVIEGGQAVVSILDSGSSVQQTFDPVPLPFNPAEGRMGFAATNWAALATDVELAVESFTLECG